jgi:hypothetical protein
MLGIPVRITAHSGAGPAASIGSQLVKAAEEVARPRRCIEDRRPTWTRLTRTAQLRTRGTVTKAELDAPSGHAPDRAGNLAVADTRNNRLRVVAATTEAFYGMPTTGGPTSPATAARPRRPSSGHPVPWPMSPLGELHAAG